MMEVDAGALRRRRTPDERRVRGEDVVGWRTGTARFSPTGSQSS